MFELTITVGDILTALAVLVSAAGLFVAWTKDRALRRKEYADRIRHAAAITVAKLERREQLSLRFFEDLQPLITDADVELMDSQDIIKVRDSFWRGVVATHAAMTQRILDEQIEIAYAHLYGYDPHIYDLFSAAVEQLRLVNDLMLSEVLQTTQDAILSLESQEKYTSAMLGNLLRATCSRIKLESYARMRMILDPFRKEVLKVIQAGDADIQKRNIQVGTAEKVLPSRETLLAGVGRVTGIESSGPDACDHQGFERSSFARPSPF